MEPLLYLVHRIPYPPNKGDKIRSFNLLRYLAQRYRVYLGSFVDSREDLAHVDAMRQSCADACIVPLNPRLSRARSLAGFLTGEALTLPYYRNAKLQSWVRDIVKRERVGRAVAFSSPMAQYVRGLPELRTIVDLVDVDSAKWTSYASEHRWPLSAVYRREGERLLAFERDAVARSAAGVLVTAAEARLFGRLAPECSTRVHVIENGVDSEFFAPDGRFVSPYMQGDSAIVFTGAMDYWPNVDAVTWFAHEVLPLLARQRTDVRFYVVGMNPTAAVRALASDPRVAVTGRVDDVRPYLQHAAAVVAPLRIARGVQNKVLEAMSMARPVVVSAVAAEGLRARPGVELETAEGVVAFADRTLAVLDPRRGGPMGEKARARICEGYSWDRSLSRFGELLEAPAGGRQTSAAAVVSDMALAG